MRIGLFSIKRCKIPVSEKELRICRKSEILWITIKEIGREPMHVNEN